MEEIYKEFSNEGLIVEIKELSNEFEELKVGVIAGLRRLEELSKYYKQCVDELTNRGVDIKNIPSIKQNNLEMQEQQQQQS